MKYCICSVAYQPQEGDVLSPQMKDGTLDEGLF